MNDELVTNNAVDFRVPGTMYLVEIALLRIVVEISGNKSEFLAGNVPESEK